MLISHICFRRIGIESSCGCFFVCSFDGRERNECEDRSGNHLFGCSGAHSFSVINGISPLLSKKWASCYACINLKDWSLFSRNRLVLPDPVILLSKSKYGEIYCVILNFFVSCHSSPYLSGDTICKSDCALNDARFPYFAAISCPNLS